MKVLSFSCKDTTTSLRSPLLKTKPNCFIKASLSCDTLDFLYGMGCQTQLWSAEVKSSPIGPDHTWVWQSMLFWEGSCPPFRIHLVWFFNNVLSRSFGEKLGCPYEKKKKKANIFGMTFFSSFVVVCFVPQTLFLKPQGINKVKIQAARLAAFQRRVDALAVSIVFSAGLEQVITVSRC